MHSDRSTLLLRICLLVVLATAAPALTSIFPDAPKMLGLSTVLIHAAAFYAATLLGFLLLPRMRRNDLALAAIYVAAWAEVVQLVVGRGANVLELAAAGAGIAAAWMPGDIQRRRRRARGNRRGLTGHLRGPADEPSSGISSPAIAISSFNCLPRQMDETCR